LVEVQFAELGHRSAYAWASRVSLSAWA